MNINKPSGKQRNRQHIIRMLLVLAMLLTALSGCKVVESISEYNLPKGSQLSEKKEKTKEAVPPSDFKKTEITILASTFKSLNPYVPQDKSMETILRQCYQGLMTLSTTGEMVGQLADQVILAEDGFSCLLTLGEKQFHDGSPVRFKDVNYSLQKARTGKYAIETAVIKKMTAQSDNQIKVEFLTPGILNLYSLCFPIVPENSLEKGNPLEIKGTGPYQLAEYKPMQTLKLRSASNQLEISLSRTESITREAFINGLTDIYFTEEFPWFSFSEEILRNISKFPGRSFYYMGFQLKSGLMSDNQIRKYLMNKLDWEILYKNAFLNHIVQQKLPFYRGKQWEDDRQEVLPSASGMNILDTNPVPAGQKLSLLYPTSDRYLEIMAQNIKEEWEAYVGVEIVGLPPAEYQTALQNGNFDVYLTKMPVKEYPNLKDFIGLNGQYNYSGIGVLDGLVNSFLTAKDEKELKKNYLAIVKEIEENVWLVPFGFLENAVILSNQVEGELTAKPFDILSGITEIKAVK